MTAYMFPPHLIRTSNISRTLAQPRLKRKSTPESLPSVALFPYRTTKPRHLVLYALIRPDASSTTERLLLFKRSGIPDAALDWATKYVEKTFAGSVEEHELPEKTFTDVAVLFSAVSLAAVSDFATMRHDVEGAVSKVSSFFEELLAENARSSIADVRLLSTRNDALADFFASMAVAAPSRGICDG